MKCPSVVTGKNDKYDINTDKNDVSTEEKK